MSERPSLHDIAAMPFPASQSAMREHYDAQWHMPQPEPGEGPKKFRVKGRWTIGGHIDQVFEADTEDEALDLAEEWVAEDTCGCEVNLDRCTVAEVEA